MVTQALIDQRVKQGFEFYAAILVECMHDSLVYFDLAGVVPRTSSRPWSDGHCRGQTFWAAAPTVPLPFTSKSADMARAGTSKSSTGFDSHPGNVWYVSTLAITDGHSRASHNISCGRMIATVQRKILCMSFAANLTIADVIDQLSGC